MFVLGHDHRAVRTAESAACGALRVPPHRAAADAAGERPAGLAGREAVAAFGGRCGRRCDVEWRPMTCG